MNCVSFWVRDMMSRYKMTGRKGAFEQNSATTACWVRGSTLKNVTEREKALNFVTLPVELNKEKGDPKMGKDKERRKNQE